MKAVRIGICGMGTVGAGTLRVLRRNAEVINARAGCPLEIAAVATRRGDLGAELGSVPVHRDVFAVATDPGVDVLVEVIGGTTVARDLVLRAVAHGKHVVTANKALIAEHGNEIFAAARERGVAVAFEAAVGGGIPIVKALREGLAANRIQWLAGIINGTGNFILSEMREKGRAFAEVLREAQALGYAEADPAFDVEGIDAAHKLVILAALAFGMPLRFDAVHIEGIRAIDPVDVGYAQQLGYRIKHLGIARRSNGGVELRVHPALIPESRLLAQVNGVMNAIMVKADAAGASLYYGAGAGAEPTASAVVADIIDIARGLQCAPGSQVPALGFSADAVDDLAVLDISAIRTAYYLRVAVLDRPGELSRIAQIVSSLGISIEAIIQKEPQSGEDRVTLILLTNRTLERDLRAAVASIEALDTVSGAVVHIRVESLSA